MESWLIKLAEQARTLRADIVCASCRQHLHVQRMRDDTEYRYYLMPAVCTMPSHDPVLMKDGRRIEEAPKVSGIPVVFAVPELEGNLPQVPTIPSTAKELFAFSTPFNNYEREAVLSMFLTPATKAGKWVAVPVEGLDSVVDAFGHPGVRPGVAHTLLEMWAEGWLELVQLEGVEAFYCQGPKNWTVLYLKVRGFVSF